MRVISKQTHQTADRQLKFVNTFSRRGGGFWARMKESFFRSKRSVLSVSHPKKYSKIYLRTYGLTFFFIGFIVGACFLIYRKFALTVFASDATQSWTFATSGDYTLSDSTLIETTGSAARLKLQEYSSDASTALLLHLNEASGSPTDSSSYGATVTNSNVTFDSSGIMNNRGIFSGVGSYLSVPDSTALSLTGAHSIESWVNFDTTFTSTSHSERQTIVDKGSYQLYFEHTSGKLLYELEPSGTKSWSQVAGPNLNAGNGNSINTTWDLNGKPTFYDSVKMGTYQFVAIGSSNGPNDSEVWRCSGCDGSSPTWTKVGGDGVFTSWPIDTYEFATTLATDGTYLYAGLGGTAAGDGDLWRCTGCDGSSPSWTKVGGDAINSSWAANTYESVVRVVVSGTTVYAGLGASAGDAEVYRCTNCSTSPSWTRIGGDAVNSSWANSTYEEVRSMILLGSNLVVGLGNTAGDGEVWSTNTTTIAWTKRGGDGSGAAGQSWGSANEQINGLSGNGNTLYVGLGTTPANEAEVWRCDLSVACTATTGWTQVGGDGLNTSWNTNYESVRSLLVSGTTVYAGLGDSAGDAEVWKCTSCDGVTPSWTQIAGDSTTWVEPQSWGSTHTQVNALSLDGTVLYVGISSASWSSEFWRCDTSGTCSNTLGWTRLGGGYVNTSWEQPGIYTVQELASGDEKIYAGLGNALAGDAIVWEYEPDTDTWTIIGGQGLNSSWTANTFESVDSLLYYGGVLYAGLGRSTADAEVWKYDGSTWTKVGGDALNSSWPVNTYESVTSMVIFMGKLYVGLGNNGNGDAEVWRCTDCSGTPSWTKVGGDGLYTGWAAGSFREVPSMVQNNGFLFVGLAGPTAGDAEVWRCSSACDGVTPAWTRVGGDAVNSSWANTTYERVDSMAVYNNQVIVGLGATAGDSEVWACSSCDGTPNWGGTRIGGDDPNGTSGSTYGWTDATYEQILDLVTYNGSLYAGLGISAGESELWRYDDGSWTKVGGDGLDGSWDATINYINSLAVHEGKLYSGTGGDANSDATIWSYGNDSVAKSAALTLTAGTWYHIAATYDGSNMKLYVNGVQSGTSKAATLSIADNTKNLLIGRVWGSRGNVSAGGSFAGKLDELRISSTARSSFNTTAYTGTAQTIQPNTAVFTSQVQSYDAFTTSETANGGAITYRLSNDGGTTWKYYNAGWVTSSSTANTNDAATINTNIATFPISSSGILWQAVLDGDGSQQVTVSNVTIGAISDVTAPTNPDSLTALSASSGGSVITTNTWYPETAPYFSWSGATDAGAGVAGYYVYFGTDNTADPVTAGAFQAGATYTASSLSSGSTYYLRIKAKDNAQNTAATAWQPFIYKFDNTAPSNPSVVTVSPAGYAATNSFTFSWPSSGSGIASDGGSGVAGYQYKTGASSGALSSFSSTITDSSVTIADAAYQTGENTFYLRTVDTAGNVSSTNVTVTYYFAGSGPGAPQFLSASPSTNTVNSFAFSWNAPATYSGLASELTYCYTVNTLPSAVTCTFTSAGATSLSASSFATQTGLNTFYVVAKNGTSSGGAINYGAYTSATFTANTSAPGIPLNIDVADISVKSTSTWRLTVSWSAPTDSGSGVANYQVYRSTDDVTFTKIATTTGTAYVDPDLSQVTYYYKVKACDNVNNCGAFTSSIGLEPTGKYTDAAGLSAGPTVGSITTKGAIVSWSTDRTSDSKVQYGTSSGSYFSSEPSNSTQITDHSITLTNLSPGTTYYYKAKWTDEDGNTGVSGEKTFKTSPAPVVTDPKVSTVGLSTVSLTYTVSGASKVKIYYGKSASFGNVSEVSTSTSETSYTTILEELDDGTKYFYKINSLDSEGAEYEGSVLTFETLPRPKISSVKIQQIVGTAQSTLLVSWSTNTEVSSIITYYPEGENAEAKDQVNVALKKGDHRMVLKGLKANTSYQMVVSGVDKAGNKALSDVQKFSTATDTRPPQISGMKVAGSNIKSGEQIVSQLTVSWSTDEPSTSQVEFAEGTGTTYSQKTQEDGSANVNHTVVITGLSPSKVYHLRALSKDVNNNQSNSVDTVTITPKATDDALNLVISNLQQVFGFIRR